jgi:hypothetical protein
MGIKDRKEKFLSSLRGKKGYKRYLGAPIRILEERVMR